jgi:hypothetical protein
MGSGGFFNDLPDGSPGSGSSSGSFRFERGVEEVGCIVITHREEMLGILSWEGPAGGLFLSEE